MDFLPIPRKYQANFLGCFEPVEGFMWFYLGGWKSANNLIQEKK